MKGKVLVLGGGITGLNLSYQLLTKYPKLQVCLVEKGNRVGGWINTFVQPQTKSKLEVGPRSLRPSGIPGLYTLQLIHQLNLQSQLLPISKKSELSKTRYIYYDSQLVKLPNSLWELVLTRHPMLQGLVSALALEPFRIQFHSGDVSIRQFFEGRIGIELTNRLISALTHGIYAGDIASLSMQATFKSLFLAQQKLGSLGLAMLWNLIFNQRSSELDQLETELQAKDARLYDLYKNGSMYSFQNGMQTLPDSLRTQLTTNPNFELKLNFEVTQVQMDLEGCTVQNKLGPSLFANQVVSCLPHNQNLEIFPKLKLNPYTNFTIPTVDVITINLMYKQKLKRPTGFGYLLPIRTQPLAKPDQVWVEGIDVSDLVLGVVFDLDTFPQLYPDWNDGLTLMVGGHHFQTGKELVARDDNFWAQVATQTLKKHLQVDQKPDAIQVNRNFNCIPQFPVHHLNRLVQMDLEVARWEPKVKFCSSSYFGVAINDCIMYSTKWVQQDLFGTGFNQIIHDLQGK